ncbi:DMT family transporter [Candidatus Pelagibacter sp. Uisw_127]|uniref:DMT family transporter n=1 Tax=Candidatus Pelagibacter sp. Uisw_127 TaxID=3230988 RepID=UPI0039EC3B52
MTARHYFLVLFIMFIFGSSYPVNKLALNTSLPPMLAGSLRMLILFICLLPFCKFKVPNKKYFLPLAGFSLTMGFGVIFFLNLSLGEATFVAPIIIGAQLAIPFALLASSIFLGEKVNKKQWLLILVSFFGIFLIGYDPNLKGEIYAIFLCSVSAFFYGIANVFSRYIKEIDVKFTNMIMGFTGFITILLFSIFSEGNTVSHLMSIDINTWLLLLHNGIMVSVIAHTSMFYLYKFYSVNKVMPFYSLFPIFGLILTFFIFGEIPTLLSAIGGTVVIISVYQLQKIR